MGYREDRTEAAQAFVASASNRRLRACEPWDLVRNFHVHSDEADSLINRERLKRGLITMADLSQQQRCAVVDPSNLDLHALAAGPIMDSDKLYLPAGRISLAEARWREHEAILEAHHG